MKFQILRFRFINKYNHYRFSSIINPTTKSKINFERISEDYWLSKTANVSNMCGISELNEEDIAHSNKIFHDLKIDKNFNRALDVGAGIGRITFNVLYDKCEKIDMLDINRKFLESALIKEKEMKGNKIHRLYPQKLQDFNFEFIYDLIFIQWVLEYLNEENFVKFLSNAVSHLKDDGYIIIKENVNLSDDNVIFIEEEGSLIRPIKFFESVFKNFRLNVKSDELVIYKNVKYEIYDVNCWVLSKI